MHAIRVDAPAVILSLFLCAHAPAAPQSTSRVILAPWRIGAPREARFQDSDPLRGAEPWHELTDDSIADVLYGRSLVGKHAQFWLDFGGPGPHDTSFAQVVGGIERLDRLIQGNLRKGRAAEVVVFPFYESETLTTVRCDDGWSTAVLIVGASDQPPRLTWRVGEVIVGPRSETSVEPPRTTRVTFDSRPNRQLSADTGVYRCELTMFDELWHSDHRLYRPSDTDIAHAVAHNTAFYKAFQIQLGIDNANATNFATVATWIKKLKRLIEANAREGCPVEIVVFPLRPAVDPNDDL